MSKAASVPKTLPGKRRQGRPVSGKNAVGRERLLEATERLLRTMPSARVTISRVAREADVDTALVHYYFGTRSALLLAVVDRITAHGLHGVQRKNDPVLALADHIGKTVGFVRSASFMHRLIIDELAQEGTVESRARIRAMNLDLVEFYRELLHVDAGRELTETDPFFLHLAILGASDFFASAEPLIRELLPESVDMETLATGFQEFLIRLILDGVRKR